MKNAQISRTLGIHRHTVEKYLAFKTPLERQHFTKKVRAITPYEDYILKRWKEGCLTTPCRYTGRSQSKAIPVPTRTSLGSPAISRSKKFWKNLYRTLRRVS